MFWPKLTVVKNFDGREFIGISIDSRSKFSKKKKTMEFLILEGWLRDLLYIFPLINLGSNQSWTFEKMKPFVAYFHICIIHYP